MPRNEKELEKERNSSGKGKRKRAPVMLILILLLIAIIALLLYFKPFGLGGGGLGFGGNGSGGSESGSGSVTVSDSSESEVSNTAVIRIDGNDIYFDGEKCADAAALKEKITAVGNGKDYELDHSTAIKSTYDEVKQVLSELENALDIKVNYNE